MLLLAVIYRHVIYTISINLYGQFNGIGVKALHQYHYKKL